MNLKQRLKLEKELFFIKYIFKKPIYLLGDFTFNFLKNPNLLLLFEFIVFGVLLFRGAITHILKNYPIVWGKSINSMVALIILTMVYKAYSSQKFNEEYQKEKEEKIKEC